RHRTHRRAPVGQGEGHSVRDAALDVFARRVPVGFRVLRGEDPVADLDLDADDWQTLSRLLVEALELPDHERGRWLDSLPPEHQRYRTEIETLLTAHGRAQAAVLLAAL